MRRSFVCFLLSCLIASSSLAATHIVRPDGTGDFPTIQAAISAAVNGDVSELTTGIFMGTGNRDISYLGKAVTVRSQRRFTVGEGRGSIRWDGTDAGGRPVASGRYIARLDGPGGRTTRSVLLIR